MAFERLGLGGVLTFEERQAVGAMKRASRGFENLNKSTDRSKRAVKQARDGFGRFARTAGGLRGKLKTLGREFQKVSRAFTGFAVGGVAMTYMLGRGARSAAGFEQAIADLGAVSRASESDMSRLTAKAEEMGIVTAFSASESAQAMEMLARAGANVDEQISGVRGVLDAAAAGNINYARTSEIIATITRGMGREFSQAKNMADILALAASKSNVTIQSLGESFRYGMAQAKTMGISTEELTAIFGKLGDAGLVGSIGGTALTSMLVKLAKPSRTAEKLLKDWRISLTDATGAMRPMSSIVADFSKKIGAMRDASERAKTMTELFGIRGQKAYAALAAAGKKSLDTLTGELRKASDGLGAATEMAEKRLDTLMGSFKMLGATVEGFAIAIYGPALGSVKEFVQGATSGLNSILMSLKSLQEAQAEGHDLQLTTMMLTKQHGETATAVAMGLLDIVNWLRDSWNSLVETVGKFGAWLKSKIGVDGVRALTRLAGKLATIMATVAPLLLAFKAFSFVIGRPLVAAISVLISISRTLITTLGGVTTATNAANAATTRSIGLMGRLGRVAGAVGVTVWAATELKDVWDEVIRPLATGTYAATKENIERGVAKARSSIHDWAQTLKSETKRNTYMALSESLSDAQAVDLAQWVHGFKAKLKISTRNAISEALTKVEAEDLARMTKTLEKGLYRATKEGLKPIMEATPRLAAYAMGIEKPTPEQLLTIKRAQERYQAERSAALDSELKKRKQANEEQRKAWLRLTPKEREKVRREQAREEERRRELERKGEYAVYLENNVNIDGKKVAGSLSKHQQEIQERAGFKATPWQRRMMLEQGAMPATTSARNL